MQSILFLGKASQNGMMQFYESCIETSWPISRRGSYQGCVMEEIKNEAPPGFNSKMMIECMPLVTSYTVT